MSIAREIFEEFKIEMQAKIKSNALLAEYGEEKAEGRADAYQYAITYLDEITKKYIGVESLPASEERFFSAAEVRNMTPQEVRENYKAIRESMYRW